MEIKGVKYIAPVLDNSGYAQAARGNIIALHKNNVPVTVQPISFESAKPNLGVEGEILHELIDKHIDYNIVIVHTTPEFWERHVERGKTNVGYTIWETSKLHPEWPEYINKNVDKVLVGCEWNKGVFEDSGVSIPVGVVPHVVNTDSLNTVEPYQLSGVSDDVFTFYNIQQWCYDEKTRILTREGFKYFKDLSYNDDIATMNPDTEELEYQKPEKIVSFRRKDKMFSLVGQFFDVCVTPDHKMVIKDGSDGSSKYKLIPFNELLFNGDKISEKYIAKCGFYKENNSGFTLETNEVSMSEAEFKEIDYDGYVYCATVPNHIMLVERNGKTIFSGNTERKHPIALLKAYWYAFQAGEDVALVLKTYRSDYSDEEKNAIRTSIRRLKQMTPMDNYPPIYLITDMLSNDEIVGLHKRGDCYVSTDRGEGFGLSPFLAGACGNPLIVTGFGGSTEYAKEDNSYLINYTLTPVSGMPWCISLNSLVKTTNGYIKARNLVGSEVIINKNLNNKNINKIEFRELLESEEMYSLKAFSFPISNEVTSNHKLYVLDNNDVPVKRKVCEINVGDYLYVPKPAKNKNIVIDEVPYDSYDDLFYLFGVYLAEGYIDRKKKYIGFCFNITEKHTIAEKCKEYMYSLFYNKINSFYDRDLLDRNGYEMIFYSDSSLLDVFEDNFGCGSYFKFINEDVKYNEYNYMLLKGYWDGDGHIRKEGYKNRSKKMRRISPECVAETASFDLSMDIRDLLLSLDIVPSVYSSNRKDGRSSHIISISDENFDKLFGIEASRIKSKYKKKINNGFGVLITKKELIEDYDDLVCSISVDTDFDESLEDGGSYILNGIASSNSPWYRGDQLWAEPDVKHTADLMRHVYKNQDEAKETGSKIQNYINTNFTYEVIGKKLVKEIEEL